MTIIHADCLEAMRQMDDNSVDAIVTDPPYGINFMGRKWDYDVPSVEIWAECLRVLKPGGHMLAFSGTRTQHRMAVNIEDAGFELRDVICYHYGSGFPKNHSIGKAIDKAAGLEREVVGERVYADGHTQNSNEPRFKGTHYNNGEVYQESPKRYDTAPASPEAAKYDGFGTALKPATEFISLCRKPLSEKTIAANVLKWGTGGLNIDGCRVGAEVRHNGSASANDIYGQFKGRETKGRETKGRFPANLILDDSECVRRGFPENVRGVSGATGTGKVQFMDSHDQKGRAIGEGGNGVKDSGSAARFFYCAKASKADRGEDNSHPTVKPTQLLRYLIRLVTPPDGIVLDPFFGSGSTGKAAKIEGFDFIGIEREAEYVEIAKRRIEAAEPEKPQAEQLSLV